MTLQYETLQHENPNLVTTKFCLGDMKFSWMWPKIPVIWDVMPRSLVPIYKHFGEISSTSIFKVDKSILKAAASGKQLPKFNDTP